MLQLFKVKQNVVTTVFNKLCLLFSICAQSESNKLEREFFRRKCRPRFRDFPQAHIKRFNNVSHKFVSDLYWESSFPQDRRTWIAPQIYLPPTFEAYRMNRDAALEAIINYQGENKLI